MKGTLTFKQMEPGHYATECGLRIIKDKSKWLLLMAPGATEGRAYRTLTAAKEAAANPEPFSDIIDGLEEPMWKSLGGSTDE